MTRSAVFSQLKEPELQDHAERIVTNKSGFHEFLLAEKFNILLAASPVQNSSWVLLTVVDTQGLMGALNKAQNFSLFSSSSAS